MNNYKDYLKIDINIENNNLYLYDKTNLNISIKNESDITIDSGLFKIFCKEDCINLLDYRFKHCVNEFCGIPTLPPHETININIPIEIINIPSGNKFDISCSVNFHIVINGQLMDKTCVSDFYRFDILTDNKIDCENLTINSIKDNYLIDEDIYLSIKLKNPTDKEISYIDIKDFVPKNSYIINQSLLCSIKNRVTLIDECMTIDKLYSGEQITIKFKVNILPNKNVSSIIFNPSLNYKSLGNKLVTLKSNALPISIKNTYLFDSDNFNYSIDKKEVLTNNVVTHEISITNTSKTYISNIFLANTLPLEFEFVANSLVVNDIYRVGEDLSKDIKLGDLEPDEHFIIRFKTAINSDIKEFDCLPKIIYDINRRNIVQYGNTCNIKVIKAYIDTCYFTKSQNKQSYNLGDIIDFDIKVINTGNIDATNILLFDKIPKHLELVDKSLTVNNESIDVNILNGIKIASLKPYEALEIGYKAKAIDIGLDEKSNATITYSYLNKTDVIKVDSNTLETSVIGAKICNNNFIKQVDKTSVQIGDTITTHLLIENTGNLDCSNIKIYEPLNSAVSFLENSVTINGENIFDLNIFDGIFIESLKAGNTLNITYQSKVIDYPKPNPIDDKAVLIYDYIKNNEIESMEIYSIRNKIYVSNADLSIIDNNSILEKNILTKYVLSNEDVHFSLKFENNGNVALEDIFLKIDLPDDFITDNQSIKINNHRYEGNLNNGIKVPNLNISQEMYIDFHIKCVDILYEYKDINIIIEYNFKDIKTKDILSKSTVLTQCIKMINPDIDIIKSYSDTHIELGREFNENIRIKNTGNIDLENVVLSLNKNECLEPARNSIFINGCYVKYEDIINLDKIDVGEIINLSIKYKANSVPSKSKSFSQSSVSANYSIVNNNCMSTITKSSNQLKLDLTDYNLSIKGKSNSAILMIDKLATYTFNVSNLGNIPCENIKIKIDIPDVTEYVQNSFTLNGKNLSVITLDKEINIKGLLPNESYNFSFGFIPLKSPYNNLLDISISIISRYHVDDEFIDKEFVSDTKPLEVESLNLDIIKSVSHDYLQSGDILKIHTVVQNSGSLFLFDIKLFDNEDKNLVFVEDSVCIDGEFAIGENPLSGLNIGSIPPADNKLISYEYEYIPSLCATEITHYSEVEYTCENKNLKPEKIKSSILSIQGSISIFRQFNLDTNYKLKVHEPSISEIVNITSSATIDKYYDIESINKTSYENISSTGKKILLKGILTNTVEYLTKDDEKRLYLTSSETPFTTFINLPNDYDGENLNFLAKCSNTYKKLISDREIFISNLILIEGSI